MNIKTINERFSTTGQITPDDIAEIVRLGFTGIVCARPDGEDAGQPGFDAVAAAARQAGLKIAHVPVSGAPGEDQIARFARAMEEMDGSVLGYCRSGGRAGSLYAALER